MIKYPVKVRKVDTTYESMLGGWNVLNADGSVICTQDFFVDANAIANSLNAMNELPNPSSSTMGQIMNWFRKWLNTE